MRSILVPLDGSRFADSAVPTAVRLATAAKASLRLVTVHSPRMPIVPAAEVPVAVVPDDPAERERDAARLAEVAARLGVVGAGPVQHLVLEGLPGNALADHLEREPPDLVVMSTHGRGPLSRFWLGSVADHLVRHVSVPLLLLRPHDAEATPVAAPLGTALVPLDLSSESEAILAPLRALARLTGARLTLMFVIEPVLGVSGSIPPYPVTVPHDLVDATRDRAEARLAEVAGRLREDGLNVVTRVVVGMGVAGTVLEQAEQGHHDFIAMTTHGAGGMKRLLLGSVTDKVVRASHRPVLVYRPRPASGSAGG